MGLVGHVAAIYVTRLLTSSFLVAGLFVSKMSSPLIIPVVSLLTIVRLIHRTPLPTSGFGLGELRQWRALLLAFSCAAVCHAAISVAVIWGFHGFRYTAVSPAMPEGTWDEAPWETVMNKPAPVTLFDQVQLGPLQREEVKRIFARERAEQNAWSASALRAVEQVKRNVLAEEQASHLDQLMAEPPPQFFPALSRCCGGINYCRKHTFTDLLMCGAGRESAPLSSMVSLA